MYLSRQVAAQSARRLAASRFLVPLMMAVASMSQPFPSVMIKASMGAPDFLTIEVEESDEMPIG